MTVTIKGLIPCIFPDYEIYSQQEKHCEVQSFTRGTLARLIFPPLELYLVNVYVSDYSSSISYRTNTGSQGLPLNQGLDWEFPESLSCIFYDRITFVVKNEKCLNISTKSVESDKVTIKGVTAWIRPNR